jgi:hypothetical protein
MVVARNLGTQNLDSENPNLLERNPIDETHHHAIDPRDEVE